MSMKVLMFGWELPPYNSGGLGTACLGLTKAMATQNVEVTFVVPYKVDVHLPHMKVIFAGMPVKIKGVKSLLYPYVTKEGYYSALSREKSPFYGCDLMAEVRRYSMLAAEIALSEDFDVIHAHDWLSFGAGIEAKKVSGKPLVVHVHATEFDRSCDHINQEIYNLEKQGMEAADKIIAVSQFTKSTIVNHYGISPDKIEVVWNGINADEFRHEDGENAVSVLKKGGYKIVLFVGRITMQKGPDYFLLAAKKVLQFNPKVYFVIVGSGDMEQQIMQQAAFLGISDKVVFPGFLRGEELNQVYRAADLFVLPSVSEPFGITPLESIVNGTPALVSYQSGVAEALKHALKVDFWDTDEMANKILAVLDNPSLIQTLQNNGHEEIKNFTWHSAASKCLNIYQRLFKRH